MKRYPDITVNVYRSGAVESVHRVAAVVVDGDGRVTEQYGDEVATFWRSAAKPFQAWPWVDRGVLERFGWADRELAIMCASHIGTDEHASLVRQMLADMGLSEAHLLCHPVKKAVHECSGNHCGFLAVSVCNGWNLTTYQQVEHPSEQVALDAISAACGIERERIELGTDGCGIVTYRTPISAIARAFARLPQLAPRVEAAMRAHPRLVEGDGFLDTDLMRAFPGAVSKCGAEGLGCARLPDGRAVVVKAYDGADRANDPALITLLTRLSGLSEIPAAAASVGRPPIFTDNGLAVGELAAILP